jgi:hypothetical protein
MSQNGQKKSNPVEAISDIVVAETDLESGAEASDFENEFEDFQDEQAEQAPAQDEPQAAASGRAPPTRGLPQGRNISIHPFVVRAKGVKSSEVPHINKDNSPLSVLMLFFTQIFSCWWNRRTCTTSNTWKDKSDRAADCQTLRFWT